LISNPFEIVPSPQIVFLIGNAHRVLPQDVGEIPAYPNCRGLIPRFQHQPHISNIEHAPFMYTTRLTKYKQHHNNTYHISISSLPFQPNYITQYASLFPRPNRSNFDNHFADNIKAPPHRMLAFRPLFRNIPRRAPVFARTMVSTSAPLQEWLVIMPDYKGALDKRLAARPKHLEGLKSDRDDMWLWGGTSCYSLSTMSRTMESGLEIY
jgi:hypothetical protein